MNIKHILYIIFTASIITLFFSCSSQKKLARKAKEAYRIGEYAKAIDYFERLLEKEDIKSKEAEYSFMIANCYKNINNPKKAERFYNKALRKKFSNPEALLYLADQLLKNEEYEEALSYYEEYLSKEKDNERAKYGIQSCSLAVAWANTPSRYIIENMKAFNTRE